MLFQSEVSAQREGEGICPIVALHHGEAISLEAGIGYHKWWEKTPYRIIYFGEGVGASVETILVKDPVYGVRVEGWLHMFLALGLGAGYYTNFEQGTVVLQPEIGFGFAGGRVSWRPTIPFGTMVPGMSESDLTVCAVFVF